MAIEIRDDTPITTPMPAGSWLIGGRTSADPEPTAFARESVLNYIKSGLATVATSGSASDLSSGTVPAGRLHAYLSDISSMQLAHGDILYYDGANLQALGAGSAGHVLQTGGPGASPSWVAAAEASVADGSITNAKIRDAVALSVIGRGGTTTGDVADITGTAAQVLRVASDGGGLAFGAVDLAAAAAVTGALPVTNGGTGSTSSGDARAALGLAIGSDVQAWDAQLDEWSTVDPSPDGKSLVAAADYAAMRALLDLEAGTDFLSPAALAAAYQPLDSDLTAIAALTTAAYGRGLLEHSSEAALKAGINLEIGVDVQAYDADLSSWAGVNRSSGFDTFATTPSSANLRSLLTDETGTGSAVFANTPTLVTPVIGVATGTSLSLSSGTGLTVGSSVPFSDASGTLTLQNVDALDATTEATIEASIDTLANLTSIQGRTVTLADAGANAIFGWDDTAGAYENLSAAEATAVLNVVVGDSGAGGTKGLVPAPAAGDAAAQKFLKADGTWTAPSGTGDVNGPSSSVDNELVLFSGTGGKTIKRATTTGLVKASAGVIAAASAGTDYYAPGSTDVAIADGGTGSSSVAGARLNLGLAPIQPQGRLTLSTGVPCMTSNVTAAGTLYYTPYNGLFTPVWDGTNWMAISSAEVSIALSGGTASRVHDVFAYSSSGTLTLELLAWTDDKTRATALARQDGRLVKSGDATRLYLGSVYLDGSKQANWVLGGLAAGGTAAQLDLWNMYNQVDVATRSGDTTDNWTYALTAFRSANGSSTMRTTFVVGISEHAIFATYTSAGFGSNTNAIPQIGLDSTTAHAADSFVGPMGVGGNLESAMAVYNGLPGVGRSYLQAIEKCQSALSHTFLGDAGITGIQTGLSCRFRM